MPSILLVEDDQMDIMNVQRELRKNNVAVPLHIARNGREALDMLRGQAGQEKIEQPSVVILDINMPRMNGLELLDQLRSDPEFVGLNVFITTTSDLETERLKERVRLNGHFKNLTPPNF